MRFLILSAMLLSAANVFAAPLLSKVSSVDGDLIVRYPKMKVAGTLYPISGHVVNYQAICATFDKQVATFELKESVFSKDAVRIVHGRPVLGSDSAIIKSVTCN